MVVATAKMVGWSRIFSMMSEDLTDRFLGILRKTCDFLQVCHDFGKFISPWLLVLLALCGTPIPRLPERTSTDARNGILGGPNFNLNGRFKVNSP